MMDSQITEVQSMRCPNCGAEIGNSDKCEYCGSYISADMKRSRKSSTRKAVLNVEAQISNSIEKTKGKLEERTLRRSFTKQLVSVMTVGTHGTLMSMNLRKGKHGSGY
jgi:methionyl-tRNA synthetase